MKALIILLVLPLQLLSQDISGIWTGLIHTRGNDLLYEVVISENKEKLSGYSLTIFTINGIENVGVKSVILKKKKGNISIEDDQLIYNNYTTPPKRVKLYGFLSLNVEDSIMTLSGTFHTRLMDYRSSDNNSYTGTIDLQKQKNFVETRLISQLDKLNLLNTLSFLPPKVNDKEVIAIVNPPVEKPKVLQQSTENERITAVVTTAKSNVPEPISSDPDLPKSKEIVTDLDTTSIKNQPTVTIPKEKEAVVATQKTETKIPAITPPEQKEVVSVAPPKPVTNAPTTTQPKQKEAVVVQIPKSLTKTPIVTAKQKEVVKVPSPTQEIKIQAVIPPKQKDVVVTPPLHPATRAVSNIIAVSAADLAIRKIETIRSVNVKSDSLVLNLYDNGEVDGDTVSVILNGKTIISRQGLTANAITKTVYLTPDLGDSIQLIMYAENLGSIPPNTGLLILQDGNDRYEIRFAGDMQKNSAIILRRKR
jgi:hypothetical protein